MKLDKYKIITVGLVGITTCSGLVLASFGSYADNDTAIDQVEITVPTACTMTGNIVTGQEHTASLTPGTYSAATGSEYANGIGKTTLTTFCNDNNGFSIYTIGYTGDIDGTNTLIGTNTGATINTKAYESTDTQSNWSMKVNKVTDSSSSYNPQNMTITNSFDNYHAVPNDYTKVAEYKSTTEPATTDTTLGAKVETTYAAYVATNQSADTYTGKVKYVMVHPYDATAPEIAFCDTHTCMQDLTSASIATLLPNVNSTATVYDKRDEQAYTIAKLADDKYWMTENLNIAGGTFIDCEKTDCENYSIPEDQGWGLDSRLPVSSEIGFDVNNYAYVYNSGNKTECGANGQNVPCYSYYSWDVATLGSGRTISTENTDAPYSICPKGWRLPTTGSYANNDWKRGDYYRLATAYGANLENNNFEYGDPATFPFLYSAGPATLPNFIFANYYANNSFSSESVGTYWSSTSASDNNGARSIFIGFNYVVTAYGSPRFNGYSVRCLFGG